MIRIAIASTMLLLAGCEKESTKAQRQANIVDKGTDEDAKCEARKKVAEAYLKEENQDEYRRAKSAADSKCLLLELQRNNRSLPY